MSTDAEIVAVFEELAPARQKELLEYQDQVRQDTASARDLTVERPAKLDRLPIHRSSGASASMRLHPDSIEGPAA
jgi:hypothetical protein